MKYFFDTEFIEEPNTIELISIGIVCQDGRKYYAISSEFDESKASQWVVENVISKLGDNPRKTISEIKKDLLEFIPPNSSPQFWAYFCAYDWVVFCWIFGKMIDLPDGYPMWCRDLKQLMFENKISKESLLPQGDGAHNALEDAIWNMKAFHQIESFIREDNA